MADHKTVTKIIDKLSARTSAAHTHPVVVLDPPNGGQVSALPSRTTLLYIKARGSFICVCPVRGCANTA